MTLGHDCPSSLPANRSASQAILYKILQMDISMVPSKHTYSELYKQATKAKESFFGKIVQFLSVNTIATPLPH
jgi:hypothetical protein